MLEPRAKLIDSVAHPPTQQQTIRDQNQDRQRQGAALLFCSEGLQETALRPPEGQHSNHHTHQTNNYKRGEPSGKRGGYVVHIPSDHPVLFLACVSDRQAKAYAGAEELAADYTVFGDIGSDFRTVLEGHRLHLVLHVRQTLYHL